MNIFVINDEYINLYDKGEKKLFLKEQISPKFISPRII